MEQLRIEGYVNYRCRGPAFPLNCTESVAPLDGSEENPQSEVINVEVYTHTHTCSHSHIEYTTVRWHVSSRHWSSNCIVISILLTILL